MESPATIFFLLQDVPQLYGAERVTLELIQGLSKKLPVVLWLIGEQRLGEEPGAMARAALAMGIRTERYPVAGRFSWSLVRTLRERLRENPDSIIHTVGYKAHIHALAAARGGVAKTVTTIHGWLVRPEIKERIYEWIEIRALQHDDAVVCLTSFYEQRLLDAGVRRNRLHRIPTGLAAAQLPNREQIDSWPEEVFTIALLGRLSWEKNHGLLLRAAARLQREGRNFRVLLAGEGPCRDEIVEEIGRLGLAERVQLIGYVALPELMPTVHAVALCSRIENLPLSLLEAMAWSRPVVATSVGGVPDVVVNGETGFLIPDDDDAAYADRIARLIGNPEAARKMGRAGRARLEAEFQFECCIERHLELYTSLAKPHHDPASSSLLP